MRTERVVRFKTTLCALTVERPAGSLIVLTLSGRDTGELGEAPFQELERDFTADALPRELFIDARGAQGASIEVSGAWAQWLHRRKPRLRVVHFLTASRFIQLSADFVRKFAELGDTMRIYTEASVFDEELESAIDRELAR